MNYMFASLRSGFFTGFRRSLAALSAGGCVVLPGQGSSSQELVERINSLRIDHLSCVTSQINVLAQKISSNQVRFPNLKSLLGQWLARLWSSAREDKEISYTKPFCWLWDK